MAKPLLVEIYADASQYQKTLDKAAGRTRKFGAAAKIAGGLLVTGLAVGLERSVHAAVDAEKSQTRLEQAFKNAHLSIGKYKEGIDAAEAAGRKLGFTDDQTRQALGSLIVSTGSYTASVRQMAIAQDLARFKGVDLESAVKALTMAHAGSLRPLKQLGIDIPKVTDHYDALSAKVRRSSDAADQNRVATAKLADKQATFQNVLSTVTAKVHGQADAYSHTAAGSMAQFHAQTLHLQEVLGAKLLPALVTIIDHLNRFIEWVQRTTTKVRAYRDAVIDAAASAVHWIGNLEGLSDKIRQVAGAIQTLYNWLRKITSTVWNITIHAKLPDLPIPHLKIPGLAEGGIVNRPTLAMVGESGPEAVVPLTGRKAAQGRPIVIPISVSGVELARVLIDPLRGEVKQLKRRGGSF